MVQKVTLVYRGLLFVTQYKAKTEEFVLALRSHRQINFYAGDTKITGVKRHAELVSASIPP